MTPLDTAIREMVRSIVREEVERALSDAKRTPDILTVEEAADFARVAAGTIRRWGDEGKLEKLYAGRERRVRRADLERLLRREQAGKVDIEAIATEKVRRRLAR